MDGIDHQSFIIGEFAWFVIHERAARDFGWCFAIYRSPGANGEVIASLFSDNDLADAYVRSLVDWVEFCSHKVEVRNLIHVCGDLKLQGFTHVSFDFNPAIRQHKFIWTIDGFISECRKPRPFGD